MHILITGCTDTHVNNPDRVPSVKFVSTPELLGKALEALGHHVYHRAVTPGENLNPYDKVFCFLYPLDRHARHPDGAIWTMTSRPDAIIGVDDWACYKIEESWAGVLDLKDRRWIAPVFDAGHPQLLRLPGPTTGLDFTCMLPQQKIVHRGNNRQEAWVHASYHIDSHVWARSQCDWTVYEFGCKQLGQERIFEEHATVLYGAMEGCLCPPYDEILGAGWWRPRIVHAVRAGAIVAGRPADLSVLGSSFTFSPRAVERMDGIQRTLLAALQGVELNGAIGTREILFDKLINVLEN
jgi:hypothetical protein